MDERHNLTEHIEDYYERENLGEWLNDFEEGALTDKGVDRLFQYLIDTRAIYSLKGFYPHVARALHQAGRVNWADEENKHGSPRGD